MALIDLGDTLADCTPALLATLAQPRPSNGAVGGASSLSSMDEFESRRRAVLSAPGFWRALAPRPAGLSLLGLLRDAGFKVMVLTKGPQDAPQVWADKVAWCREHLPGVPVTVTDDKAAVPGDVLVDDWLPYVESWQRRWPSGLAIVPAQPWNAQITLATRCLHDDGRDRAAIVAALRGIRRGCAPA
ncbi:5' nucleotidase, NT5C type [Variovorax rhizosphaerae]|uniref:HAD family hydrolase n=1 Tax=Variovorax rhizosphaerae TaxID=1836200 RepID=A0ABU8WLS0_9BURK